MKIKGKYLVYGIPVAVGLISLCFRFAYGPVKDWALKRHLLTTNQVIVLESHREEWEEKAKEAAEEALEDLSERTNANGEISVPWER